jgi:hypothetical protein
MTSHELAALLRSRPEIVVEELAGGRVVFAIRIATKRRDGHVRLEVVSRHVTYGSLSCVDGGVWIRYSAALAPLTEEKLGWIADLLSAQARKLSRIWESVSFGDVLVAA